MKQRIDTITCMIVLAAMLSLALLAVAFKYRAAEMARNKASAEAKSAAEYAYIMGALTNEPPVCGEERATYGVSMGTHPFRLHVKAFNVRNGTVSGEMEFCAPDDGAIMTFDGLVSSHALEFHSRAVVKQGRSTPGIDYTLELSGGDMAGEYKSSGWLILQKGTAVLWLDKAKRERQLATEREKNAAGYAYILSALTNDPPVFGEEHGSSDMFRFVLRVTACDAVSGTIAGEMEYYPPDDGAIMTFAGRVFESMFKFDSKEIVKRGRSNPGVSYTLVLAGQNMEGPYRSGGGGGKASLWLDRAKRSQLSVEREKLRGKGNG
ncbi:MAG: hypothetical protein WCN95_09945 [bacterium]